MFKFADQVRLTLARLGLPFRKIIADLLELMHNIRLILGIAHLSSRSGWRQLPAHLRNSPSQYFVQCPGVLRAINGIQIAIHFFKVLPHSAGIELATEFVMQWSPHSRIALKVFSVILWK